MDDDAVITLAAERSWPENEDARFFRRDVDTLAPFEPLQATWRGGERNESGAIQMPWVEFDTHGERLREFAYLNRPFNWVDDPRRARQEALLASLRSGQPAELHDWAAQQLWDILLAVVRADRFNEGVYASHAPAGVNPKKRTTSKVNFSGLAVG